MKRTWTIFPMALLALSVALPATAGMNHRPHNAKIFMGSARQAPAESPQAVTIPDARVRKSLYDKGVERSR